ncbi:stage II sporulation protein P [Metabacillus fastidiosus]|uniref:stage II sporulation protein P n=1 Tax=Metabacillus fastidiosus TaxID=1458 RepID=UPI002DB584BF|nr:stage II sporulation protein P [Metabacillus fastidiosus]MEC2074973.1 stage II sporulation protein P [Metabacillus fastidiosus]
MEVLVKTIKRFAHSFQYLIEKGYKGLSKGVMIKDKTHRNGVYNQDLSKYNMIIEIGGVENNLEELYRTAEILGIVISKYYFKKRGYV